MRNGNVVIKNTVTWLPEAIVKLTKHQTMTTLSGHLVASHHSFQRSLIGPFGVQVGQNNLVQTSDNAFFDPTMHGNFGKSVADMSFMSSMSGSQEMSEATANQIAMLQAKLDKKLGPEYVSQRPGNGGMRIWQPIHTYVNICPRDEAYVC